MTTLPKFFAPLRYTVYEADRARYSEPSEHQPSGQAQKDRKNMRYVAYVRISSEDQVGNYSLDAQQRAIDAWVMTRGGVLTRVYKDEAQSGRTSDRPAFQELRKDARAKKYDAIVVHKFDRFARNRTDALAVKTLLRHDFGIKIFSVTEPSEDDDGPMGALVEGIMESVADWYSRNLATETAKGKKERATQGLHNNIAPFGMKKNEEKILVPDEKEIAGLKLAFELYATDQYSDNDIAVILNKQGYRTKRGRYFSKDTVRDFLQNEIYLGKVSYQPYVRNPDNTRSRTTPTHWFEGKHEPVISEELYRHCQEVRIKRAHHHQPTIKYNPYLLRDIVYCYRCCLNHPTEKTFPSYGKMRPQSRKDRNKQFYRCRATELGYTCEQKGVYSEVLDDQVVSILMQLKPPPYWRETITTSIGALLGEKDLEKRLNEIRDIIRRMDQRWDLGFFSDEQEYLQQRIKLQQELEQLTPIDNNELERAADMLANFTTFWQKCGKDVEAQHKLIKQIVERVYVEGDKVVAMTLKSNCHLVLGHKINEPTEYSVDPFMFRKDCTAPERYTCGDDGI